MRMIPHFIAPTLHAAFLALIPAYLLKQERFVPRGAPLKYPELGRAMTAKERARASYERNKETILQKRKHSRQQAKANR